MATSTRWPSVALRVLGLGLASPLLLVEVDCTGTSSCTTGEGCAVQMDHAMLQIQQSKLKVGVDKQEAKQSSGGSEVVKDAASQVVTDADEEEKPKGNKGLASQLEAGGWIHDTWVTGYWDCCKPSCSWPGKGRVNKPVLACDGDTGRRLFDANVASVCDGGTATVCSSQKPFVVRPRLSMGFAAAAVSGTSGLLGDTNCGQCYELVFTDQRHDGIWGGAHPEVVGKSLVVQVSNIGYDVTGTHSFDIQIPGAGMGKFTDGCSAAFQGFSAGDFDCSNHYGGCDQRSGCERLPEELRSGCQWKHDWYHWLSTAGTTNNPFVKFRRVQCPTHLTNISMSTPEDDLDFPALDLDSYL